VRGAPAIGVTGALALAVHLISGGRGKQYSSVQACLDDIAATMDYLVTRWGQPLAQAADLLAALQVCVSKSAQRPAAGHQGVLQWFRQLCMEGTASSSSCET
jgi:methylthioribose-1-phosphate isomerase